MKRIHAGALQFYYSIPYIVAIELNAFGVPGMCFVTIMSYNSPTTSINYVFTLSFIVRKNVFYPNFLSNFANK